MVRWRSTLSRRKTREGMHDVTRIYESSCCTSRSVSRFRKKKAKKMTSTEELQQGHTKNKYILRILIQQGKHAACVTFRMRK